MGKAQQAPTVMVALMAGSVASSNFSSIVGWWRSCSEALAMSAKLGSHGGKDIAKVMAITNGSAKRGS